MKFTGGNILLEKGYSSSCYVGGDSSLPGYGVSNLSIGTEYVFSFGADEKIISWVSTAKYNVNNIEPIDGKYYFYLSADTVFHTIDDNGVIRCYSTGASGNCLKTGEVASSMLDVTKCGELLLTPTGYVDMAYPTLFHPVASPSYTLTGGTLQKPDADPCRIQGAMSINLSNLHSSKELHIEGGSVTVNTTGQSSLNELYCGSEVTLEGGGSLKVQYIRGKRAVVTGGSLMIEYLYGSMPSLESASGEELFCYAFDFGAENAGEKISFSGLPDDFLSFGITADENGKAALWLPGSQTVTAVAGNVQASNKGKILFNGSLYIRGGRGDGSITLTEPGTLYVYQNCYILTDTLYDYSGPITLQQAQQDVLNFSVQICDTGRFDVTLDNLNLKTTGTTFSAGSSERDVTIHLIGENHLEAVSSSAILKGSNGTLTISGPGSLFAYGGASTGFAWNYSYAAIGGSDMDVAHIYIRDCTVFAKGGPYAAGIGFGRMVNDKYGYKLDDVCIENADVTAYGGLCAAGIGGGQETLSWVASTEDAGWIRNIIIRNSTVVAIGGAGVASDANNKGSGAGIGSGSYASYAPAVSKIVIENSTVTAIGGNSSLAAGIGYGEYLNNYSYGGSLTGLRISRSLVDGGAIGGAGKQGKFESADLYISDSTVLSRLRENSSNRIVIDNSSIYGNANCLATDSKGNELRCVTLIFDRGNSPVNMIDGWGESWKNSVLHTDVNMQLYIWLPREGRTLVADAGDHILKFDCQHLEYLFRNISVSGVAKLQGSLSLSWQGQKLAVDVSGIVPALDEFDCILTYGMTEDGYFYPEREEAYYGRPPVTDELLFTPSFSGSYVRAELTGKGIYADTIVSNVLALPEPIDVTGTVSIRGNVAVGETVEADMSKLSHALQDGVDCVVRWNLIYSGEYSNLILYDLLPNGNTLVIPEQAEGANLYCTVVPYFPYASNSISSPSLTVKNKPICGHMELSWTGLTVGSYVYAEVKDVSPAEAQNALTYRWERVCGEKVTTLNVTTAYYRLTAEDIGCDIRCHAVNASFSDSISAHVSVPDPSLDNIKTELISLDKNVIRYQMTNNSMRTDAALIVAAYDGFGRMKRVTTREISLINGMCTEDLSQFDGVAELRLFWVVKGSTRPLCADMRLDLS